MHRSKKKSEIKVFINFIKFKCFVAFSSIFFFVHLIVVSFYFYPAYQVTIYYRIPNIYDDRKYTASVVIVFDIWIPHWVI